MGEAKLKTEIEEQNDWQEKYKVESSTEKFWRRSRDQPFIPIGLAAGAAAIGYGIYSYKYRSPDLTLNRYIMRYRLIAQGTVVGAILVGLAYSAFNESSKKD